MVRSLLPAVLTLTAFAQPTFFRDEDVKVVDQLQYGQTTQRLQYTAKPPYLAVHFQGQPGDRVDIRIDSIDGQASAALTDSRYKPIVSGFGSHVTAVLPPSAVPNPNEYFVVFQEARKRPATFTVSVQKTGENSAAAAEDYLACRVDTDCVAVPREGCCHNGYQDAVNKDRIEAYRAANACKLRNTLCPQFMVEDTRAAQCNFSTHQCEMVEPNTVRCGGSGDAAHACPAGYTCRTTGTDIPGICAK